MKRLRFALQVVAMLIGFGCFIWIVATGDHRRPLDESFPLNNINSEPGCPPPTQDEVDRAIPPR